MADDKKAEPKDAPAAPADQPIDIMGGALVTEVQVSPLFDPIEEGESTIRIVTTEVGTLSIGGIVPVGWKGEIPAAAYSANWMAPDGKAAEKKADAELARRAKAKAAK